MAAYSRHRTVCVQCHSAARRAHAVRVQWCTCLLEAVTLCGKVSDELDEGIARERLDVVRHEGALATSTREPRVHEHGHEEVNRSEVESGNTLLV